MKNLVYFILLSTQIFFAQTGFENANVLYKQGSYQEAIDVYETIIYRSQQQSPELYFNLANCYYKLNKVAPSIYNYEKALLLNPDFEPAKNNLEIAKKMQIDDIKIINKTTTSQLLHKITSNFYYDTWAWIALFSGFLFLLLFIAYYLSNQTLLKRIFFSTMLFVFVMMLLSISSAVFEKSFANNNNPAIVFAEVTPLLSSPKNTGKEIMKLHEGTKVFVLLTNQSYSKVQLTDGNVGWIESKSIKEVKK